MTIFFNLILIVQVVAALAMIGLILVQHGKGADAGAAFGGGGSASLFGASGGANFLSRSTAALAAVFFVCTLALAYLGHSRPASSGSVLQNATTVEMPAGAPDAAAAGSKAPAAGQIPGQ